MYGLFTLDQTGCVCIYVYLCMSCMFNTLTDKTLSGRQGQGSIHLLYLRVGL